MTVTSDEIYAAVLNVLQNKFAATPIDASQLNVPDAPVLAANRIYLAAEPYFDEAMQACVQVTLGALVAVQADPAAAGGLVEEQFSAYAWTRVAKDTGHGRYTQLISAAARSVLRMQTIIRSALIMSRLNGKASNHVTLMTGSAPLPMNAPAGWICKGENYRVRYEIAWP